RRVRVHEGLEHILTVELVHTVEVVLVAARQRLADLRVILARELQADPVVLHASLPQLVERGGIRGPRRLVAVERVGVVGVGIEALLQQRQRVRGTFARALFVQVEDRERDRHVAVPDRVIELGAVRRELVEVLLREEQLAAIERLEIGVEDLLRHRIVERQSFVLEARQQARRQDRGLALRRARLQHRRRRGLVLGEGCGDGAGCRRWTRGGGRRRAAGLRTERNTPNEIRRAIRTTKARCNMDFPWAAATGWPFALEARTKTKCASRSLARAGAWCRRRGSSGRGPALKYRKFRAPDMAASHAAAR